MQFFLLLPLGLGLFLGSGAIGPHKFISIWHNIAYSVLFGILAWSCYGVGSKLASMVLRPWQPSLWIVLLAGFFFGGFALWAPLREMLIVGFEPFLQPDSEFRSFWPPPRDNLGTYIVMTLQAGGGWLLFNWLDFRFRRVPRFGFAPPATESKPDLPVDPAAEHSTRSASDTEPAKPPRLSERLPDELRDAEILALEAEEHYTKIHTSKGNTLVLLRFSDAISEMEPQSGMQVHRSYWVNRNKVKQLTRTGKRLTLEVQGDLEIPVSRSYRVSVMNAGFNNPADNHAKE